MVMRGRVQPSVSEPAGVYEQLSALRAAVAAEMAQ